MRLHMTNGWSHRLAGPLSPGTSASIVNFVIWLAVLTIVLLMAVSTAH